MSLYERIMEAVGPRVLKGKVGTLLRSKYVHQAVDVVGAIRPACRPHNVSAVLRISPRLDAKDVSCKRCKRCLKKLTGK